MATSRKLKVSGEVISYCTKCRMDLNHRIIAMVASAPVKVECLTCGSHHKFRRPAEERLAEERRRGVSGAAPRKPRSASARAQAEAAEEQERERGWQSKIAGKGARDFSTYSPQQSFQEGELVRHFKFGDGYVVRVIDASKIEVMFQAGSRTMAHGLRSD